MRNMELTKPQEYKARLAEKYFLNEGEKYMYLHFELEEPKLLDFQAGQYLSIKVNEKGERRSYSFVSTPDITHAVSIAAEIIPGGLASEFFLNIEPGRQVEILAPMGRFMIDEEKPGENLLFVASGSGIVPLYCMINDLLRNKKEKRQVRLHWGLRREEDIFWLDNLERLVEEYDNFVFDLVLSKPREGWELCWGHVQDCIQRDLSDLSSWEAYVSGNKEMIKEVSEVLVSMRLPEERIFTEKFY